ncbi:MAG TPA: PadR family transcriptional regulator [Thermoplasmata archaeon]|nr:PadR family transcriptional regulator [Thermoplasmata archaeon]
MRKKRGLRNWILAVVRRRPRNGAEIMDDMEVMTHGWWRPSPGSVYPLLEELVTEGALRKRDDGRYELVNGHGGGWDWPHPSRPRSAEEVVRELNGLTAYLEDLRRQEPGATQPVQVQIDAVVERLRRLRN